MKFKNFIKKHKIKLIVILVILILAIIGAVIIYKALMPNSKESVYGNRLNNAPKINEKRIKEMESIYSTLDITKKIKVRVQGAIISVIYEVNPGTETDFAKQNATKILEILTEEEKTFFDIQIFLTKEYDTEEGLKKYNTIGYKHNTNLEFIWASN